MIVLATNPLSGRFPRLRNKQFPLFTYIVLTAPPSDDRLAQVGGQARQGIEDAEYDSLPRLTPDNRILFGGSDARSTSAGRWTALLDRDLNPEVFRWLRRDLWRTFPCLNDVRIEHQWGGPVSVPADFLPATGYLGNDRRIAHALGCLGPLVALMNMASQVMRNLVLERRSDLTDLFFVNHRVIPLPPEPVRLPVAEPIQGLSRVTAIRRR